MESRVGSLALSVRAPAGAASIAPAAEKFAVRLLRRCDARLSEKAPGRIFVLRSLDLSLRLFQTALEDDAELEACAEELAGHLERRAAACGEEPRGEPDVAVFEDEATWRAAHLEVKAAREAGSLWRFTALEQQGEPFQTLLDADRELLLVEVLSRLERRGTLRRALAALPRAVVELLGRIAREHAERAASGNEADRVIWRRVAAAVRDGGTSASTPLSFTGTQRLPASGTSPRSVTDEAREPVQFVVSSFGGLFYLLSLALELELADILWRACLPERVVLARAAETLLDGAWDPAPELFGGAPGADPLPDIAAEQQNEVALALLEALIASLPRRGLAELPQVRMRLVETAEGRLLCVSASESPFVLLALAARTAGETRAAFDAFLELWPSQPVSCDDPALADLDRRARLRVARKKEPVPLLLADGPSLASRALVTQAAGTLAHLFAARIGGSPATATDLVSRHLAVPAEIELERETMQIRLSMERLDLDVRRAGLDRDPGWVPWLERHVRFDFVERSNIG